VNNFLGAMDDDDLTMGADDWYDYCKKMFRKVTKNDLVEFENKYKGKENNLNNKLYLLLFIFKVLMKKKMI
jgi:hypothetical protein